MKFNFKKINVEADVEGIIKKGLDNHEKDWKEKLDAKHKAKKELQELKHKQKLELDNRKQNKKNKYQFELENQIRKEEFEKTKKDKKNKERIRNISIILIFVYGLFCISGFRDRHIISAIVSLIQIFLMVVSILMCEDIFHLFKKDYKILFITSILLIVLWLAFAI